jgi:hypothetical protein
MADFSESKKIRTAVYPVHAKEASGLFKRVETLITPAKLKSRYLKGIPLTTPNGDKITDADLKDYIQICFNDAELELNMPIDRVQLEDRLPFDRNLYNSFVHCKTTQGPIRSIEEFAIQSSNGQNFFEIPADWIDAGQFHHRQVNVIPYSGNAVVPSSVGSGGASTFFLIQATGARWIPSYWTIKYTVGLMNQKGQMPEIVNDLIGTMAAIYTLSQLGPTQHISSQSLSQDGISQSSSGPGVQRYKQRLDELEAKKDRLISKIKGLFSRKFHVGST